MWGYAELFGVRPIGMGSEKYGLTLSYGVWGVIWSYVNLSGVLGSITQAKISMKNLYRNSLQNL